MKSSRGKSASEMQEELRKGGQGSKTLCYVYDAQVHTLTLKHERPLKKLTVQGKGAKGGLLLDRTYEDLLEAEFISESRATGKTSEFTIEVGTKNELRGVPVQIKYQPNWWFQVVLNLRPESLLRKTSGWRQEWGESRQLEGGGM